MSNVSELLRTSREREGLTQDALAYLIGIRRYQQYANMEYGACKLPLKYADKICEHLCIKKEDLLHALVQDYIEDVSPKIGL